MCPTCLCVRRFSQSSDEPRHRFPPDARPRSSGPLVPHPSGAVLSRGAFSSPRRPPTNRQVPPSAHLFLGAEPAVSKPPPAPLPLAADASGRACGATSLALSREGCRFCPNPRVHSPPLLSHRTLPLPPVLLSPAPATSSVRLFLVTQTLLICPCLKNSTARTRPTRHPRARGHPWPPCCQSPWPSPRLRQQRLHPASSQRHCPARGHAPPLSSPSGPAPCPPGPAPPASRLSVCWHACSSANTQSGGPSQFPL